MLWKEEQFNTEHKRGALTTDKNCTAQGRFVAVGRSLKRIFAAKLLVELGEERSDSNSANGTSGVSVLGAGADGRAAFRLRALSALPSAAAELCRGFVPGKPLAVSSALLRHRISSP